jgi:hypothetical protein
MWSQILLVARVYVHFTGTVNKHCLSIQVNLWAYTTMQLDFDWESVMMKLKKLEVLCAVSTDNVSRSQNKFY